jgi:beta-lactamase class A
MSAGLILLPLFVAAEPDAVTLASRIDPIARAHQGRAAVAVRHLVTGETYTLNADQPMPTASLIKFPIMVETFRQVAAGKVKWTDEVTLTDADKVPGSGILTPCFSAGVRLPLKDAVRLMIAVSDNTATNLVLDRIGIASPNKFMAELGLPETRVNAKVFRRDTSIDPERSKKYGLGSTTAGEMVRLLTVLHEGQLVDATASKEMVAILKLCDDKDKLPALLPPGVTVAHKTGSVTSSRTDAGILELKSGPVAVCVLTDGNADTRWKSDNAGNLLCAKVARAVYDHYEATAAAAGAKK